MLLMLLAGVSVITSYLATFTTFTGLPPAPAPPPDHWLALGVAAGGDQVTILPVSRLGRGAAVRRNRTFPGYLLRNPPPPHRALGTRQ